MSPEDRQAFEEMKKTLRNIQAVTDVSFIENAKRRIVGTAVTSAIAELSLNDLRDVDISSPTNDQVLKYTTTGTDRWVNGTDNTA